MATLNFSGNANKNLNKNLAWQSVRAWGDNVKVSAPPWPTPYIISQGPILPIKVCRAVSPWLGSQPTVVLTSKSKAATYELCRHPCLHVCAVSLLHTRGTGEHGHSALNSLEWQLGVTKALSAARLWKLCFLQSDLGCWHFSTGIKFIWLRVFRLPQLYLSISSELAAICHWALLWLVQYSFSIQKPGVILQGSIENWSLGLARWLSA